MTAGAWFVRETTETAMFARVRQLLFVCWRRLSAPIRCNARSYCPFGMRSDAIVSGGPSESLLRAHEHVGDIHQGASDDSHPGRGTKCGVEAMLG